MNALKPAHSSVNASDPEKRSCALRHYGSVSNPAIRTYHVETINASECVIQKDVASVLKVSCDHVHVASLSHKSHVPLKSHHVAIPARNLSLVAFTNASSGVISATVTLVDRLSQRSVDVDRKKNHCHVLSSLPAKQSVTK